MKRKLLGITSIRSDYDLMSPLYNELINNDLFDLKLIVSGAHLSSTYGNSVELIKLDGHQLLLEIETLIDSDSSKSRIKTASIFLQNSIDIVSNFSPSLIMYSGDREDSIMGALLGAYLQIPTAHFYGGDHVQDGHVDNPIRHSISKLSTYHFVSNSEHATRLKKMGEHQKRIYNIGALSLDNFKAHKKIKNDLLFKKFNLPRSFESFCIVIFHPLDKEMHISHSIIYNILQALQDLKIHAFISYPNTDPANKKIIQVIEDYKKNKLFHCFKNLSRDTFLSLYKNSIFQIGNSSSGIVESASIPLPVVNVGERQKGRLHNGNVIFCDVNIGSIKKSIKKAMSKKFIKKIENKKNVYGDGYSTPKAVKILENMNFKEMIYKTEDPIEVSE